LGGLFDARAGLRPHMHLDLTAVDGREEVLAEIRSKREREQGEAEEPGDHLAAVAQCELEQTAVGAADGLEAALEGLLEPNQRIATRPGTVGVCAVARCGIARVRPWSLPAQEI